MEHPDCVKAVVTDSGSSLEAWEGPGVGSHCHSVGQTRRERAGEEVAKQVAKLQDPVNDWT